MRLTSQLNPVWHIRVGELGASNKATSTNGATATP